jgi:hypothetical protein
LRDGLELIADFFGELGLVVAVPEFVVVVDAVDFAALVAQLHEEVGVVVGLLSVEVHVRRPVYLELFVYALVHLLLVQTLTMDSHLLTTTISTETGSFTFLAPYGLLEAITWD